MTLRCHGEDLFGGLYTGINTRHIYTTSKMVMFGAHSVKLTPIFPSWLNAHLILDGYCLGRRVHRNVCSATQSYCGC